MSNKKLAGIAALIALLIGIGIWAYVTKPTQETCYCGHIVEDVPQDDSVFETQGTRKIRKVWFGGGTVRGIDQATFQRRVMQGYGELSAISNTDFVQVPTKGGAWLLLYVASDDALRKKWRDPTGQGRVPLALQFGNQLWFREADPRWTMPTLDRLVEVVTMHESGHRLGIRFSENPSDRVHSPYAEDVMSIQATARELSSRDKIKFREKLGTR